MSWMTAFTRRSHFIELLLQGKSHLPAQYPEHSLS